MAESTGRDRAGPVSVERVPRRINSQVPLFAKLTPGPGKSPDDVAAHQTARVMGAMTEIVATQGYEAVTVRDLSRLAGVSTHTFYRHFSDKQDCLLHAYDEAVRRITRQIVAAEIHERDWTKRLRMALRAFGEGVAADPNAARMALIEAFAAGPPVLERMRRTFGLSEAIVRDVLTCTPDRFALPPLVVKGIVAGVICVARGHLLEGRQHELPELADELAEWTLCYCAVEAGELGRLSRHPAPVPNFGVDDGPASTSANRAASDRALILAAVTKLSKTKALGDLSTRQVRSTAGVSQRTFDKSFADVEDCFLAAVDLVARAALTRAAEVGAAAPSWPRGVHRAFAALCEQIAHEPTLARLGFTEALTLGSAGIRHRAAMTRMLAERLRASAPPKSRPTALAAEASIGSAWAILHHQLAAGRAHHLNRLTPTLAFIILAPAIGPAAALSEIRADIELMTSA